MRVLPTNTTTPRYNNKYIRVSSRNNFPPIYQPPHPPSPVSLHKLVLRLSSCCVPQRSLINIAATELAGGFSSRFLLLPLPLPLFSFPLYVLSVKLLPVFCHDFVPMSWHNLCVLLLRNFHLFFRARYVCSTFSTKHAKKVRYLQKNPDFLAAA